MGHQFPSGRHSHRYEWLLPIVMAGLAVGALLLLNSFQPEPVIADVDESSAVELEEGLVEVTISWSDDRFTGTRTQVVRVDPILINDGKLAIWNDLGSEGDELRFTDPSIDLGPEHLGYAAAIGALLGVVVLLSLRGYGYVRGTGEIGSMTPDEVREDRGFYWRT